MKNTIKILIISIALLLSTGCSQEISMENNTNKESSLSTNFPATYFESNSLGDVEDFLKNDSTFVHVPDNDLSESGFFLKAFSYQPDILSQEMDIAIISKNDFVYTINFDGTKDNVLSVLNKLMNSSEFQFTDYNLTNSNSNMHNYINLARNEQNNVFISIYKHPDKDFYEIQIVFLTDETIFDLSGLTGIDFNELTNQQ